jgi:hypothetical protein
MAAPRAKIEQKESPTAKRIKELACYVPLFEFKESYAKLLQGKETELSVSTTRKLQSIGGLLSPAAYRFLSLKKDQVRIQQIKACSYVEESKEGDVKKIAQGFRIFFGMESVSIYLLDQDGYAVVEKTADLLKLQQCAKYCNDIKSPVFEDLGLKLVSVMNKSDDEVEKELEALQANHMHKPG